MKFSGVVKTVKYQKDNFVMLGVELDKSIGNKGFNQYKQRVYDTVKGNMLEDPKTLVGLRIDFEGEIETDKNYGNSVKFSGYKVLKTDDFFLRSIIKLNEEQLKQIKSISLDWKGLLTRASNEEVEAIKLLKSIKGIKDKKVKK